MTKNPWAREFLSYRRLMVTFGVAGTMGVVEWIGLGHPIGLVFGLLMGFLALLVSPLPWLWILPWGLKIPVSHILLRALVVLGLSAAVVVTAYLLFFSVRDLVLPPTSGPIVWTMPHLSSWSALVISIPLFAAAGWGLSRHSELERRLEVRDERELALRQALDEARLLALQSRLDPHFLFNALNLVAELCREEPEEAERCVVRLSGLLRAALEHADQGTIPLGRELDLCADFLELCRARFGERLQVKIERDAGAEEARVPLFAVQVLCENAVRHGVERTPGGGEVRIVAAREAAAVRVQVTSPGPFRGERVGGLGIELTRRRLALAYRGAARLEVKSSADGTGTLAELVVPRRREGAEVAAVAAPGTGGTDAATVAPPPEEKPS